MSQENDNSGSVAATAGVAVQQSVKPKSARRWAREFVLQGIYEYYVAKHDPVSIRIHLEGSSDFKRSDKAFFREMWLGLFEEVEMLTKLTQPHIDRPLEQVSPIERAIVLIGAWELCNRLDIPYRVAINESVELAKVYGGTDGHKWVNGVLDKLAPQLRAAEVVATTRRK